VDQLISRRAPLEGPQKNSFHSKSKFPSQQFQRTNQFPGKVKPERCVSYNNYYPENKQTTSAICGILNKIVPDKFELLTQQLLRLLSSPQLLQEVVNQIHKKSVSEHRYSSLYANLCRRLWKEAVNFDCSNQQDHLSQNTFRRLLIEKLQLEFEARHCKLIVYISDKKLPSEEEEKKLKAKHHVLGNIKIIGELYILDVLQEAVVHTCIKQLMQTRKKGSGDDEQQVEMRAVDVECLCQLMTTCGKKLDHEMAKSLMDQYFVRMLKLKEKSKVFPSRIRFMIQDVVDLRKNKWQPRRQVRDAAPKTLMQIRGDLTEENPQLMFDPNFMRVNKLNCDNSVVQANKKAETDFFDARRSPASSDSGANTPTSGKNGGYQPSARNGASELNKNFYRNSKPKLVSSDKIGTAKEKKINQPPSCIDAFTPKFMNNYSAVQAKVRKPLVLTKRSLPLVEQPAIDVSVISRQLLVCSVKTNEYLHHLNKLHNCGDDKMKLDCCTKMLSASFEYMNEAPEEKILKVCTVLQQFVQKNTINSSALIKAFTESLEGVSSLVTKMKNVTLILSKCVDLRLLDLEQVAGLMRSMQVSENAGTRNLTIFLSTLKRLDVGRDELATMFEESGVDLVSFLPDSSAQANEGRVVEELKRLDVSYLDKMLVLKVQVNSKLDTGDYKGLKICCAECKDHHLFLSVFTDCILNHIFPEKLASKERKSISEDLLEFLESIVNSEEQQTQFVSAIESYCKNLNHPEGLQKHMLKVFHFEGIIDQSVLVGWKTDLLRNSQQQHDVLEQVQQWLKSLELSDSSDSE